MRTTTRTAPWMIGPLVLLLAAGAQAATQLTTTLVASGLARPVFVTSPPDDERLFIVEQRSGTEGRVRIVANGALLARPFLRIAPVATGSEQGLLGLAFAPDYATSGRFYVHYNDAAGTTRLARYTVSADPDSANPTGEVIYSLSQPFSNHNGGWIAFGPDGYLWMALGDGGSGGDPGDRAQNIDVAYGKILRFDVSGMGNAAPAPGNPFAGAIPGLDAVWCFGLRNPWRCSFDRLTGDLILGDVGQDVWEEIDFAPASAERGKGWNWGWRCYEGNVQYAESTTTPCGSCGAPGCELHFPAYVYSHTLGRCSVTAGYVYRGCRIPDLQGTFFFGDYCGAQIYSGTFVGGSLVGIADRTVELDPAGALAIGSISSFGEDAFGELYVCDLGGEVYRIDPRTGVAESDMPELRVATAAGDTLGATGVGNAIAPGITPFAHPGSRLRGVGYLKDAAIRACPESSPGCSTTHLRLGAWDCDVTACVDVDSATLARTFVFTNASQTIQALAFVDVVAPLLGGDADVGRAFGAPAADRTVQLAIHETSAPALFLTQQGVATNAILNVDLDAAGAIEARVAADAPLTGSLVAGPAALATAISFDFGWLAPAAAETALVVTRLLSSVPTGTEPGDRVDIAPALGIRGPMPFRTQLQMSLALPRAGRVRIEVFDARGRRLRRLVDGERAAGSHVVTWDGRDDDGRDLGSGSFFVRLRSPAGERSLQVVRVQ